MPNIRVPKDKLEYVQRKVIRGSPRLVLISLQAVESVLRNPPRNPNRINSRELERINNKLTVPLHRDIIESILFVAQEYERTIIHKIKTPINVVKIDDADTKNNSTFERIAI
jgi:hypothetical protein